MNKILFLLVSIMSCAPGALAMDKQHIEYKIVEDIGKRIQQFKTPDEVLAKVKPALKADDFKYLSSLVAAKQWVELPVSVMTDKNLLTLEFSNKLSFTVEITNHWRGEFKLNGYQVSLEQYKSLEEQMSYLRRVVKTKLPLEKKDRKGAFLYSLMFPSAQASLTCNALVNSGCVEVSVAATMWFVKSLSMESPLARCRDVYYYNRNNDVTAKCLQDYKNNPTLRTIQELSEMLVTIPDTSVEISCGKSEGPTIWIGGSEVVRLGKGLMESDYSITQAQDSSGKLRKLPDLAIKCCKSHKEDPLAGSCEEFLVNNLGSHEKRKKELQAPNLRIRGQAVPGVK